MPVATVCLQRPTGDGPDVAAADVPRDGRTPADMVRGRMGPGPTAMADGHAAYGSPGGRGYGHHAVSRGGGGCASGGRSETHANSCECRMGPSERWLKRHRGVSKRRLALYAGSFRFVHNRRRCGLGGRLAATPATVPDSFGGGRA